MQINIIFFETCLGFSEFVNNISALAQIGGGGIVPPNVGQVPPDSKSSN